MATPDSTPIETATARELSGSRRTTISTFNPMSFNLSNFNPFTASQQRNFAPKNGSCTHLTMTRLYTTDFRCAICYQVSAVGWVYRCTQDRELTLEDEFEKGYEVNYIRIILEIQSLMNTRKNSMLFLLSSQDRPRLEGGVQQLVLPS
jgi:hypothetical protein